MNSTLTVKKSADTGWRPVMYRVIEMTVGANLAGTYCAIMCVRVGWDTEAHYNDWKAHKVYAPLPSPPENPLTPIQPVQGDYQNLDGRQPGAPTGMAGTLGAIEVVALSTLKTYNLESLTPDRDM